MSLPCRKGFSPMRAVPSIPDQTIISIRFVDEQLCVRVVIFCFCVVEGILFSQAGHEHSLVHVGEAS